MAGRTTAAGPVTARPSPGSTGSSPKPPAILAPAPANPNVSPATWPASGPAVSTRNTVSSTPSRQTNWSSSKPATTTDRAAPDPSPSHSMPAPGPGAARSAEADEPLLVPPSVAEGAASVDHDALSGDEAGALRGEETHRVRDMVALVRAGAVFEAG